MSLECGECERDLRGGHAEDCPIAPENRLKTIRELTAEIEQLTKIKEAALLYLQANDSNDYDRANALHELLFPETTKNTNSGVAHNSREDAQCPAKTSQPIDEPPTCRICDRGNPDKNGLCMACGSLPDKGCGCYECSNDERRMTTMITCVYCGNKRCPKASNHIYDCTDSNEPGQPGSRYVTEKSHES